MEIQTQSKRKLSLLTPPINEVQKRYSWTPNIPTQNKYSILTNLANETIDNPNDSNSQQENVNDKTETPITKPKIPPIYLHNTINHTALTEDIKKLSTGEFSTYYNTNTLKINLTKEDDYRNLTKHFNNNGIKYHTFQNPNGKPLNVVIKNVPLSLTEQEIFDELTKTVPVTKVTRLLTKNKQPLPICAVDLTDNENAKKIFSLKGLYHSIVTVELRRKPSNTPQCHRCQNYGHTKNYCTLDPRCVKCGGNHQHQHCSKKPDDTPKCANCGGPHPASYRGCQHHIEIMHKRMTAINNNNRPYARYNRSNLTSPNRTYADQVRNPTVANSNPNTNNQPSAPEASFDITNLIKSIINLLTPFLPQIKNFITSSILPLLFNGP